MKYFLGIDVGTSGCKVLACNEKAEILASVTKNYPCYSEKPGYSEQNPLDWWNGVKTAINEIASNFGYKDFSAIGLSGQMHGLVMLDANNKVIRPAILWNDQRTVKQCDTITEKAGGLNELIKITNNQMLTGFTGGKLLWVKENEPELYNQLKIFVNPKDYIRFMLTGVIATDVSDASGTGLFDVKNNVWAKDLIEKIGLDYSAFPQVVESCAVSGFLSTQAAGELGINASIPVSGGGGDAVISTTGLGLAKAGRIGITLGTSGVVAMGLDKFKENTNGSLQISRGNESGSFHAMGVTLAAAGSYQWYCDTFGDFEKATGKNAFAVLDENANAVPAGADSLIFLPYLTGERCPINDANASGAFLGITSHHTKAHFTRAVMEGVAYSLKQVYELVCSPCDELVLAGGGAKSEIWRQIFADVFNLPVKTVYGSSEGGAFGAVLVSLVTAGEYKTLRETVPLIKTESVTQPIAENVAKYVPLFNKYTKFYDALKFSY